DQRRHSGTRIDQWNSHESATAALRRALSRAICSAGRSRRQIRAGCMVYSTAATRRALRWCSASQHHPGPACRSAARATPACLVMEETVQRGLRRVVATHAMDATPRRRRRGADVEPLDRRRIGIWLNGRACEELPDVLQASVDVAADIVGVVVLHLAGGDGV